MQLSFMSWVCPSWDLERIATFAADSPYDGFEPRVESDHAHGLSSDSSADEREAAVELFEHHGVSMPAVATGAKLARADPDDRHAEVEGAQANAELAGDLGASYLRVFAGGDGEQMSDAQIEHTAAALTDLGEFAADHGVMPVLETMHDIVRRPEDALAVLDRAETDNVGLLWNRASITPEEFDAVHRNVYHVHMHDDVLDPEFTGVEDLMSRFQSAGYDGSFSLEIIRGEDLSEEELLETGERLRGYLD